MASDNIYSNLKKEIKLCLGPDGDIRLIKELFQGKQEVRVSKRTLHRISCLEDLFEALEELDFLSEHSTNCLVKLGHVLKNQKILDLVQVYSKGQDLSKPCSCRNTIRIPIAATVEPRSSLPQEIDPAAYLLGKRPKDLKNAIQALSSKLDVWWPVLLRELNLKECHIANIRKKHRNHEIQALKALDYWSVADQEASVEKLHTALSSHECERHGLSPSLMQYEPYVRILL